MTRASAVRDDREEAWRTIETLIRRPHVGTRASMGARWRGARARPGDGDDDDDDGETDGRGMADDDDDDDDDDARGDDDDGG